MHYWGTLIAVEDVAKARKFYEELFGFHVEFDLGDNVAFDCGVALQQRFGRLLGLPEESVKRQACNGELVFEHDDMDDFMQKLRARDDIRYVHELTEQPWGQRVVRFYDLDGHIIEVGEPMVVVVRRMLRSGMSEAEVAQRTEFPLDFVEQCMDMSR